MLKARGLDIDKTVGSILLSFSRSLELSLRRFVDFQLQEEI
jgi:hypothetical protein